MPIKSYIIEDREHIIALRRHFHQYPELSMKEYETAKKIEEALHSYGIKTRRVGETGVYGVIRGSKEENKSESENKIRNEDRIKDEDKTKNKYKRVVLRADIDALKITDMKVCDYSSKINGVMHACGHDAHTAALLGAAKALKARESDFNGEIGLIFQQGEEIGQGARIFLKEGLLDHTDRVFGIHVDSNVPAGQIAISEGPVNASVDHFTIKVIGKSAHVSTPHLGVDALYIAAQIVTALQGIVSRQTNPIDTVVIGIGVLQAGTAYNIVAGEATIEGTTRCFSSKTREFTNRQITEVTTAVAKSYQAKAEITFEDFTCPLINQKVPCGEVTAVAAKIVGEENIVPKIKSLGGDDFAEFLEKVPGMYAFVGTANQEKPDTMEAHHTTKFDIDEEGLLIAANLYTDYALSVLE